MSLEEIEERVLDDSVDPFASGDDTFDSETATGDEEEEDEWNSTYTGDEDMMAENFGESRVGGDQVLFTVPVPVVRCEEVLVGDDFVHIPVQDEAEQPDHVGNEATSSWQVSRGRVRVAGGGARDTGGRSATPGSVKTHAAGLR